MKKKVFFRYNPQTLSYERVYPKFKDRLFAIFRHLASGILIGLIIIWGFTKFFGSPRENALEKENQLLRTQNQIQSKWMDQAILVLQDIQQRDDNLYRAIFHSDPIPWSIRASGVGGISRYEHLTQISNSELIDQTAKKMDYISKQLYVQSNSFDAIVELAKGQKERLLHIPSIQPVSGRDLSRVASGYGTRIDPIYGTARFHAGMDFTAKIGTPVYVTGNGTVTYADWRQGYGKCIIVDHGYGFETLYAHLSEYKVRVGQKVVRGEQIAEVGNTGKSTGPHLHYEVHVKGHPDNPAKYYFMDQTPEEYDEMLRIAANHGQVMD